jgi:glycosyltransferase involved in cell wall biosynthesis
VPNVLRESLACGTPFVASRVGGVAEIAQGTRCRMVPAEDAVALAEALVASLGEAKEAKEGREQAVPVNLLTWEQSSEKLLRVVLAGRTAR